IDIRQHNNLHYLLTKRHLSLKLHQNVADPMRLTTRRDQLAIALERQKVHRRRSPLARLAAPHAKHARSPDGHAGTRQRRHERVEHRAREPARLDVALAHAAFQVRASYRQNAGRATRATAQPKTHRTPPDTTENRTENSDATTPDSKLPSKGPPENDRSSIDARRPRSESGIVWFQITLRKMPLIMSAAPAATRHTNATTSDGAN